MVVWQGPIMLWTSFLSKPLNLSHPRASCVARPLISPIICNARKQPSLDGIVCTWQCADVPLLTVHATAGPIGKTAEGAWALPHGEYGLDVIALVGFLRFRRHQSLPEIHRSLHERGLAIGERSILNLLARYGELVTIHITDQERLQSLVQKVVFFLLLSLCHLTSPKLSGLNDLGGTCPTKHDDSLSQRK
jgi:hypothetical protein